MLVPAFASVAVPTPYRVASRLRHWLALTSMLTRVVRAHGPRTAGPQNAGRQSDGRALCERYVVTFRSKSMNSAASSGLANMMVRSSSWIMRP